MEKVFLIAVEDARIITDSNRHKFIECLEL